MRVDCSNGNVANQRGKNLITCEDEESCRDGERGNAELLEETLVSVSLGADGCHETEHRKAGVDHLQNEHRTSTFQVAKNSSWLQNFSHTSVREGVWTKTSILSLHIW